MLLDPMRLKPLQQWFCDTCGEVIEEAAHGWFEWLRDEDDKAYAFRICHHASHSPVRSAGGNEPRGPSCYKYDRMRRADLPLEDMIGSKGMARMLAMLDVGRDPRRGRRARSSHQGHPRVGRRVPQALHTVF